MQEIIIWDENAQRIHGLERNLSQALINLGLKAKIMVNSEPPLLSRMQLIGKTPKIEINGDMWTHIVGEDVSVEVFENLLRRTMCECK